MGENRTLSQFHGEKISLFSFFHGVGIFLLTFCISMALGVMFGLACSLMLKHSELGNAKFFSSHLFSTLKLISCEILLSSLGRFTEIEACLVLLIAYTSYFFSNALTMSGMSLSSSYPSLSPTEPALMKRIELLRYRFVAVLRNHFEALRLSQHVTSNSKDY